MPALPNVTHCLKVEFHVELDNAIPALTRLYVHYTGTAPSVAQAVQFATDSVGAWDDNCSPMMWTDYKLTDVEVTDLSSATAAQGSFAEDHFGTRDGAAIPQDTAFVCAYEIERRYRGGHPRGYFPFGNQSDIAAANEWQTASRAEFESAAAALANTLLTFGWTAAGTLTHVNVSYYHGFSVVVDPVTGRARNLPTPRGTPLQDTVVGYLGRIRLGTQRRRVGH